MTKQPTPSFQEQNERIIRELARTAEGGFTIRKKWSALSQKQFQRLAHAFQAAAERSFGTQTELEIKAHFPGAFASTVTHELSNITPELWKKLTYVTVELTPVDKRSAPRGAQGYANFSASIGPCPGHATFGIRAAETDLKPIKDAVVKKKPRFAGVRKASVYMPRLNRHSW